MSYLYRVDGLLKLHRTFFKEEDYKEVYRETNFSQEYNLKIVADEVESAIVRYRNEVRQVFEIKDCEDDGPFTQTINDIIIREVTRLDYVDVA